MRAGELYNCGAHKRLTYGQLMAYINTTAARRRSNQPESNMTSATKTEQLKDAAIERFNEQMSNACTNSDRSAALLELAHRLGNGPEAGRMFTAWILQSQQAAREVRQ